MPTGISWTEETWNPVTGCSHVSAGCTNCYAERLSLQNGWSKSFWTDQNAEQNVVLHPERLDTPRRWKSPKRCFVCSMADLFHGLVPDEFIHKVFDTIEACPQHVFQVLTKRHYRIGKWLRWPDNVWAGVSIESAKHINRIDDLRKCGSKVKFISFEPLIAPVGKVDLSGVDWAICGGESGPDFRPMDMAWARELRDQCVKQGVAFFFKQDASNRPGSRPFIVEVDGTHTEWKQYPDQKPESASTQEKPSESPIAQLRLF
jgi:protein gp37